jgi:3-oxoacyl-[acyl-carrier-protein] synthase II
MAGISPLGCDWETVLAKLQSHTNATQRMPQWAQIAHLNSVVYAPAADFELPKERYNRKMHSHQ